MATLKVAALGSRELMGLVIYVNPRAVAYVRAPLPTEHGNATIVFSSGAIQSVQETVEQVIDGIHIDMPTPTAPLTPQEDEDRDPQR